MLRVLLVGVGLSAACGPIEYVTIVSTEASSALRRAQQSGAETRAVYEYTLAEEYLHKARELGGHSRWQESARFGKQATEHARRAEAVAREKAARPDETRE